MPCPWASAIPSPARSLPGEAMKVLITGGMGVMGAETSRRFVQEGHRPVIFARHPDEWLIRDILDEADIELGDVLDMPRLPDVIKRHRVTPIGHAAGSAG